MRANYSSQKHHTAPFVVIGCLLLTFFLLFAASFVLESEKKAALFSAIAILIIGLTPQFRRRLREQCSIFFLLTTAYVIWAGISLFYGRAPKLGISDYSRYLASYAVFLAVFAFVKPGNTTRWIAVFAGVTAIISFLSLDAASWGKVANPFLDWVNSFTGGYNIETYGMSYSRINGIFGSTNVMACMCAMGIFFSVYLLQTLQGKRRILPCLSLFLNAYAFMMCTSLGATASLGITSVVLLIVLPSRHARLHFAWIFLETLFCAGLALLVSNHHFGNESPTGYVVWLCILGGTAFLLAMDLLLRDRLVVFLSLHIKALFITLVVFFLAIIAFLIAAFTITKPVTITDTTLGKTIYPGSGTCEITIELDGEANLQVYSRSDSQIIMGQIDILHNALYTGTVAVEIPDDSLEIQILISSTDGSPVTIHGIAYKGSSRSGDIAPGYRLIPDSLLARLQGLPTNHSSRQRFVMMEDGLKMWKTNPILGRGLGGYENGLPSVQDYYYETAYAHNHFVQCLTELGIVGLLFYIGMLVFGFISVWKLRHKNGDDTPTFLMLLGILLMVTIHGSIEFSMSLAEVMMFAFAAFGLIAVHAPQLTQKAATAKKFALGTSIATPLFGALFAVLLGCNFYAKSQITSGEITLQQLEKCAKIDVFEGNDYRLTYIVNAPALGEEALDTAFGFAQELLQEDSNIAGAVLSEFYLQLDMPQEAMDAAKQYLTVNRSSAEAWNNQFHLFETYFDPFLDGNNVPRFAQAEIYIPAFLEFFDTFHQLSETQLDHPQLDAQSAAFEEKLRQCAEVGYDDQGVLLQIFSGQA